MDVADPELVADAIREVLALADPDAASRREGVIGARGPPRESAPVWWSTLFTQPFPVHRVSPPWLSTGCQKGSPATNADIETLRCLGITLILQANTW